MPAAIAIPALPDGTTLMLEKMVLLAGLIEANAAGKPDAPPGVVFLTAHEFGTVMREITHKAAGDVPQNTPKELILGRVTFRNAGTDDEAAVLEANRQYAEQSGFAWKRENLIVGRA